MSKYDVTYKCGHTVTVQLYGSYEDRARKIEYLKTLDCPACQQAKEAEEITAFINDKGLQNLNGSEKQIQYANKIRIEALKSLYNLYTIATTEKAIQLLDSWQNTLKSQINATWWINNKYDLPDTKTSAKTALNLFINFFKNC